jgi:hypothetical protein
MKLLRGSKLYILGLSYHLGQKTASLYVLFNPLMTKHRPLYLKTQSVPRCKHFFHLGYKDRSVYGVTQVAVCSQINAKHINTVWVDNTIIEC